MTGPRSASELDLYEVAYLSGGPARVVDTALVALVLAGRVRAPSPGLLAAVRPTRRHPVEAAVLDAVGTHGHRSVDTIQWRATGDDRLTAVGARLTEAGLLRRAAVARLLHPAAAAAPTPAGRRVLAEAAGVLAGRGPAGEVALGGRQAMTDAGLRERVFERLAAATEPTGTGLRRRFAPAPAAPPDGRLDRHQNAHTGWYAPGGPANPGGTWTPYGGL
ncbi:TIGR04222 domain-containing membrane protein [Geodermatophilus sp. CPCC 205506]|uniref:TIGR04222 domain-containing membrane protein n=1 Tax=Geodermatophilus sp. CPCC 205506 TaxID=2936596 RepID=UPI003EE88B32